MGTCAQSYHSTLQSSVDAMANGYCQFDRALHRLGNMPSHVSLLVYNTIEWLGCQEFLVTVASSFLLMSLQALSAGAFFSIQAMAALSVVSTILYWP